ncbi:MAG: nucleotidyl transferase AbiEii/AbiGii toxin family protein [Actinobacteria bacterium]|nr:nucleotidyl transferase AbiEii/AbiGii toxin family protein [Actinomycetota bacterium]
MCCSSYYKNHPLLKVDTNPVDINFGKRESFFIAKYNEIFPILKHDLPTLFAGKILAILNRPYRRGRDFYDLIWYLSQKICINITYLNEGMKQSSIKAKFLDEEEIFERIDEIVSQIEPDFILKDISRFLEDTNDIAWIKNYKQVFQQLKNSKLKKP